LIIVVFFLASGEAAFVLPHYNNTVYISISEGDNFGHLDIPGSCPEILSEDLSSNEFMNLKLKDLDLSHKFTI
jgi:hypothetical protein